MGGSKCRHSLSLSLSLSLSAVISLTPFALSSSAEGQYTDPAGRRWLVIDLGEMPECTVDHRAQLFGNGLNDEGVVVGYATDYEDGCFERGWVWSLCGAYGLAARQMTSLSAMVPTSLKTSANKISNNGVVAGTIFETSISADQPFAWDLPTLSGGVASTVQIAASGDMVGAAFDVSDASPALIVGTIQDSGSAARGFVHEWGDPGTSRTLLSSGMSSEDNSFARGAAMDGSGNTLVSGEWWENPMFGAPCYGAHDGLGWTIAGSTSTSTLREDFASSGTPNLTLWEAQARAVNAASERGGVYRDTSTDCRRRAVHWTAAGVASDLGLISPLTSQDETTVNAMTNVDGNGGVMLVGENTSSGYGVIWWRGATSSGFTAIRAVDLCVRPAGWNFVSFSDVNSEGWIVGYGSSPTFTNQRAFLLIPDICPSDLTGDFGVSAADLAILLGAWGTCVGCCPADLDPNAQVDATDLAILLGAWGSCDPCSENSSDWGFSSGSQGDAAFALEELLAVFGQTDASAFIEWLGQLEPTAQKGVLDTLASMVAP